MKVTVTILPGIIARKARKNRKAVRPCQYCIDDADERWNTAKELGITFGKRKPQPQPFNTRFRVEGAKHDACGKHVGRALLELVHAATAGPK